MVPKPLIVLGQDQAELLVVCHAFADPSFSSRLFLASKHSVMEWENGPSGFKFQKAESHWGSN